MHTRKYTHTKVIFAFLVAWTRNNLGARDHDNRENNVFTFLARQFQTRSGVGFFCRATLFASFENLKHFILSKCKGNSFNLFQCLNVHFIECTLGKGSKKVDLFNDMCHICLDFLWRMDFLLWISTDLVKAHSGAISETPGTPWGWRASSPYLGGQLTFTAPTKCDPSAGHCSGHPLPASHKNPEA